MKLAAEELDKISTHLGHLAAECLFVHDEATIGCRLIGVYSTTSYAVISRLRAVLCRANNLLDELHCVSASLDDLLIKDKHLDDVEVADV